MKISKKVKKMTGEKVAKFLVLNFSEQVILNRIPKLFNREGKDVRYVKESEFPILKKLINLFDETESKEKPVEKTATELLKEVGYTLYRCPTFESFEQFKKYYKSDELLCKFNDPSRAKRYHIFWIVKENALNIKAFNKPSRQDEYGVSCCSISVSKDGKNITQICNRYNHKVPGCDNTFNSNLENIAEGLTEAFNKEFNFNLNKKSSNCEFTNFVSVNDVYAYYHTEINGMKIGNNCIITNEIKNYNPDIYYFWDYFIINLQTYKIEWDENSYGYVDGFVEIFNNSVEKIVFVKNIDEVDDGDSDSICYIQK